MLALKYIETREEHQFEYHRILHNLGGLYRDWGKIDEAYAYAMKAYRLGKQLGDIQIAESAFNLAKLYRIKEDAAQELYYLKQAYPLFERIYGKENPKTVEAGERLGEIG